MAIPANPPPSDEDRVAGPVTVEEWDHVVAVLELAGFTSSTGGSSTAMAFVRVAGNTGANTPGVDGLCCRTLGVSVAASLPVSVCMM